MNILVFAGRVAAAPELKVHGETKVARFRLIRNEYAGKDEQDNTKERVVAVPFTAFGKRAQAIMDNVMVGDQLIVHASVRNNNYKDSNNIDHYDYNFEVEEFEFGAPGAAKRQSLNESGSKEAEFPR